jgi:hypothetical protein
MGVSSALGSSALLPAGLGFRNLVINGGFDIWQRGTSFTNPVSGSGFTADRFVPVYDGSGATRTFSQGQFDPFVSGASITATPPSGTGADYFLRWNQSVAGTGGTYNILYHRIEDVRLIAGQQVTLSFYAKAGANLTMPTIDMEQFFGLGGSPSANVYTTVTTNVAVTTAWQRFSYTFAMPSAAGKVIGSTANSSYTSIRLWVPSNATFTFDIWGVQLERNYQPTPFEQRPIGVELALCQRYYEKSYDTATAPGTVTEVGVHWHSGSGNGSGRHYVPIRFKVEKRTNGYTVNTYNPTTSATTWITNNAGSTGLARTPVIEQKGTSGFTSNVEDGGYSWVVGNTRGHWAVSDEL